MSKIVTAKSSWKPVELGVGDFEGLIGIEELVDYEESGKRKAKDDGAKKKKKRKKSTGKNVFKVEDVVEEVDVEQCDLLPWSAICVPEEISKSLVQKGFNEPTEIQRLCIPAAIKGRRDILGAAETGSGKTLAFGIPMIYGIMKQLEKNDESDNSESDDEQGDNCVKVKKLSTEKRKSRLMGLVITPTRELAIQVNDHIKVAAKYTPVQVAVIVGGMSIEKQTRILDKGPHIVVGTPGRLWELVGSHPHMASAKDIKFLAIDETDRMLERDHFPELRSLLESINSNPLTAKKRQNFVFSATLTLVHDVPSYIKQKKRNRAKGLTPEQKLKSLVESIGMENYKIVDITKAKGTADKLKETKISCTFDEKDYYLYYLLDKYRGRTLVFCNSISSVRRLASLLNILNRPPLPLHANMQQRQRLKNLDKFKAREDSILLATDVAARGLDIPGVQHVIHYQVPRTSEGYVHRSGRTARANREGLTILLVEAAEINHYTRLCLTLKREKDIEDFPVDIDGISRAKRIVRVARDIDAISLKLKKTKDQVSWYEKAAEEMDIVIDDDKTYVDNKETADAKRLLRQKKTELEELIKKPLKCKEEKKLFKKIKLYKKKK
ncbi:ATP-dependent RNA helicase DDX24 [Cimex lectularius]|uniref:ATP-dependent RNA helicase n=1 Tax=Cimex lectularius TaxID=79782 RepID=A0A8I6SEX7_CIMLE|nr:ATP-dependent RNA helicase DDX24 [Cimex lectularius]